MKATGHQKDDPLQMKYPHLQNAPHCTTHLFGSNHTLFSPKRGPGKQESEEYHPWPSKK